MSNVPILTRDQNGNPIQNPTSPYVTCLIETGDTAYYGAEAPDSSWLIQKVTATAITFCIGRGDIATAWGNRATLTYGLPSEVFA